MNVGKRIKQRRLEIGMTQRMLAAIMDKTITTVSTWERGPGKPRVDDLPQLSKLFNCSIDWLLTGAEFAPEKDGPTPPSASKIKKKTRSGK